jgi:cold shock protein
MRRIRELVGLSAGVFALALIGLQPCGAAEPAPRDGGTIIMATSAQVQGFDPLTTRSGNRETTMAGALVFLLRGESDVASGTVKWFNGQKGYGFIAPDGGGKDVFVHISAVEKAGLDGLPDGAKVTFDIVPNRGKESAENLRVK